jgi:hypothetical protein
MCYQFCCAELNPLHREKTRPGLNCDLSNFTKNMLCFLPRMLGCLPQTGAAVSRCLMDGLLKRISDWGNQHGSCCEILSILLVFPCFLFLMIDVCNSLGYAAVISRSCDDQAIANAKLYQCAPPLSVEWTELFFPLPQSSGRSIVVTEQPRVEETSLERLTLSHQQDSSSRRKAWLDDQVAGEKVVTEQPKWQSKLFLADEEKRVVTVSSQVKP